MPSIYLSGVAALASILPAEVFASEPQPIAMEEWITVADNLPDAARFGLDGPISVELAVDKTGSVSDCRIVKSSGHDMLDEHTCGLLLSRARFRPAADTNGRPIAAAFSYSTKWHVITHENWAEDGWVRAEGVFNPAGDQAANCEASVGGRISDYMKEMACFVLVNQAKNIPSVMARQPTEPFRAAMVLVISPDASSIQSRAGSQDGWERVSHTDALIVVSPTGLRTDCRMIATRGPATMIFPSCSTPLAFRYVPGKDSAGQSIATELRQTIAYFIEMPSIR